MTIFKNIFYFTYYITLVQNIIWRGAKLAIQITLSVKCVRAFLIWWQLVCWTAIDFFFQTLKNPIFKLKLPAIKYLNGKSSQSNESKIKHHEIKKYVGICDFYYGIKLFQLEFTDFFRKMEGNRRSLTYIEMSRILKVLRIAKWKCLFFSSCQN